MPNEILQKRLENEKNKLTEKEVEIYDETDDAGTITWVFDLLNGKALFLFKFPEDYPLSPPKINCFDADRCTGFTKKSSVEFDYSRFSYSF
jgi:ubiquitin-protein ligase